MMGSLLGASLLQNPHVLQQAATFAPKAPRVATQLALRLAGVSGDDAMALEEQGLPAWSLLLVGVVAGTTIGLMAAKRYPSLLRNF